MNRKKTEDWSPGGELWDLRTRDLDAVSFFLNQIVSESCVSTDLWNHSETGSRDPEWQSQIQ